MSKLLSISALALIFLSDALSIPQQEPLPAPKFEYSVLQKNFLEVKSATIYQLESQTLIEVDADVAPKVTQGVTIVFSGLTDTELEVTTLLDFNGVTVGVFPPRYIKPVKDQTYHLTGKPNDRFGIRVRTSEGVKTVIAEIKGNKPTEPPPTDPPPTTDYANLTKLVSVSVSTLDDKITSTAIRDKLVALVLPETIQEAKQALKLAIADGLVESMLKVRPPYKDWENGFRVPIDKELVKLNISNTSDLKKAIEAIIKGMQ